MTPSAGSSSVIDPDPDFLRLQGQSTRQESNALPTNTTWRRVGWDLPLVPKFIPRHSQLSNSPQISPNATRRSSKAESMSSGYVDEEAMDGPFIHSVSAENDHHYSQSGKSRSYPIERRASSLRIPQNPWLFPRLNRPNQNNPSGIQEVYSRGKSEVCLTDAHTRALGSFLSASTPFSRKPSTQRQPPPTNARDEKSSTHKEPTRRNMSQNYQRAAAQDKLDTIVEEKSVARPSDVWNFPRLSGPGKQKQAQSRAKEIEARAPSDSFPNFPMFEEAGSQHFDSDKDEPQKKGNKKQKNKDKKQQKQIPKPAVVNAAHAKPQDDYNFLPSSGGTPPAAFRDDVSPSAKSKFREWKMEPHTRPPSAAEEPPSGSFGQGWGNYDDAGYAGIERKGDAGWAKSGSKSSSNSHQSKRNSREQTAKFHHSRVGTVAAGSAMWEAPVTGAGAERWGDARQVIASLKSQSRKDESHKSRFHHSGSGSDKADGSNGGAEEWPAQASETKQSSRSRHSNGEKSRRSQRSASGSQKEVSGWGGEGASQKEGYGWGDKFTSQKEDSEWGNKSASHHEGSGWGGKVAAPKGGSGWPDKSASHHEASSWPNKSSSHKSQNSEGQKPPSIGQQNSKQTSSNASRYMRPSVVEDESNWKGWNSLEQIPERTDSNSTTRRSNDGDPVQAWVHGEEPASPDYGSGYGKLDDSRRSSKAGSTHGGTGGRGWGNDAQQVPMNQQDSGWNADYASAQQNSRSFF